MDNLINNYVVNVTGDHQAEMIFFRMNSAYQTINFSAKNVVGFITYETPDQRVTAYQIPYYFKDPDDPENKIIFPWVLTNNVTTTAGKVTFCISFIGYHVNEETEINEADFRLNTLLSTITINANELTSGLTPSGVELPLPQGQEFYLPFDSLSLLGEYINQLQSTIDTIGEYVALSETTVWVDAT